MDEPLVLATGGFGTALARRLSLPLRANPWSEETGSARARTGRHVGGHGRVLRTGSTRDPGRALPEETWVRLGQVYGRHALVLDETGAAIDIGHPAWHENDLVQEIARRPGGRAWFLVAEALDQPVRDTTVAERVEAARAAGGTVVDPGELPFSAPSGYYRYAVHVTASSRTRSGVSWSTAWHACWVTAPRSTVSTRPAWTPAVSPRAAIRATRGGARPRLHRRRVDSRGVQLGRLEVRTAARVAWQRRAGHPRHDEAAHVVLDGATNLGRLSSRPQAVAGCGPEEDEICHGPILSDEGELDCWRSAAGCGPAWSAVPCRRWRQPHAHAARPCAG